VTTELPISDVNTALALALGTGGGFLLWYLLRDPKNTNTPDEKTLDAHGAAPTNQTPPPAAPPAPNATAPISPSACALRLDPSGLTADGVRVNVADAVTRCKTAGRADVTATQDVPASAYADLIIALARAGVPTTSHRNGSKPRRIRRREPQTPDSADSVDLPEFANTVLALANEIDPDPSPEGRARGRFGRKVFIAAIQRALRSTKYARLPRATVNDLLFRAHKAALLELSRADFVAAMDDNEVRDSLIVVPGATFHFVVAPRESDGLP